jgi:hypothetical protein
VVVVVVTVDFDVIAVCGVVIVVADCSAIVSDAVVVIDVVVVIGDVCVDIVVVIDGDAVEVRVAIVSASLGAIMTNFNNRERITAEIIKMINNMPIITTQRQ